MKPEKRLSSTYYATKRNSVVLPVTYNLVESFIWLVWSLASKPFRWIFRRIWRLFLRGDQLILSQEALERHLFMTGATGSGKTETLKHICRDIVQQQFPRSRRHRPHQCATIIIDPHSDILPADRASSREANFARDIAQFREFEDTGTDRLMIIEPTLLDDRRPCLNFFDTRDLSLAGLENQVDYHLGALEMIIQGVGGSHGLALTGHMRTLLKYCLYVLLHRPGTTLADLICFMNENTDEATGLPFNEPLRAYGAEHLPDDGHREFFRTQFRGGFRESKGPLLARFQGLLSSPTVRQFCCGASTFDLETAIDEGKTIIFSLPTTRMSDEGIVVIGQLLTAYIQSYAFRRHTLKGKPKHPIYLIGDECQYLISSTTKKILKEGRKYGLHLLYATQQTTEIERPLYEALIGNVGTVLAGRNDGSTVTAMAKKLRVNEDDIRALGTGQFLASTLGNQAVSLRIPHTAKQFRMPSASWKRLMEQQITAFYPPTSRTRSQNGEPAAVAKSTATASPRGEAPPLNPSLGDLENLLTAVKKNRNLGPIHR